MALTITKIFSVPVSIGDRWMNVVKVDFDSSYPTGGEPLTRTDLGFASTADPEFHVDALPTLGYIPRYDHANQKLFVYEQSGVDDTPLDEVDDTTNLATLVGVRVVAYGRFKA